MKILKAIRYLIADIKVIMFLRKLRKSNRYAPKK